jgi:PTS system N-acetylglucosamine-specific IIC component
MTADSAAAAGRTSPGLAVLQRFGRSLMMPIAVLPVAALLLRFGQADMLGADGLGWIRVAEVVGAAGGVLFENLPLLFAVGIAIGFARKADGSTGLAAVVGWFVFNSVFTVMTKDNLIDGKPVSMGVLSGILMGLVTALLFQKYYRVKLPPYLAFFGGRRFVPIVTAFTAVILGVAFGFAWPPIGELIRNVGEWIVGAGAAGAGVYGVINRLLLPFGLHHIPNTMVWQVFGEYESGGKVVTGDLNRFFAGDPEAGIFMAGFFPIMMFALPAAAVAMWQEARPEKKKLVGGIMFSAAFCSFLTGVTEPLEFAFLFVAPLLFVVHALLTGAALAICTALGIRDGFGFSAGFIDFALNWNKAERPELLLAIGVAYALVYYVLFRFMIRLFNLPTPGRERDDADLVEAGAEPQLRAEPQPSTEPRHSAELHPHAEPRHSAEARHSAEPQPGATTWTEPRRY